MSSPAKVLSPNQNLHAAISMLQRLPKAKLFPARWAIPRGKQHRTHAPYIAWGEGSSSDPAQIAAWAKQWPTCYFCVAAQQSGVTIVDVDNKNGKDGSTALFDLAMAHGQLPETLTTETPSRGYHHLFIGKSSTSGSKMGEGLDTPVMVPVPGSLVDGKGEYRIINPAPLAVTPDWVIRLTGEAKERDPDQHIPACELDLGHNIERAVRRAQNANPSLQGSGGNAHAYALACAMRDDGVSSPTCEQALLEHWYPRCEPNNKPEFVSRIVRNAYRYAQEKAGSKTPDALFEAEPGDDPATPESIRKTHSPAVIGFKSAQDLCADLRPPRYIVKKYIEEETTTVWFGESGNLKSFLAIELGVVVAAGQRWAGCDTEQGPTVYLCGEGHGGVARRLAACLKQRGVSPDTVPFYVSDTAADFSDTRSVNALTSEIQHLVSAAGPLRLLIVDTLAANFGGGDENSTKDMGLFLQNITRMRHALGCAALIIHHSGHGDKSRERGAYVLPGGVDARFRIDREGMSVCLRRPLKMKDGEPPPDTWFAAKVVQVGVDEDLNPITSLTLTHDPFFRPEAKAVKLGENQQFLADAAADGVTEDELRTKFQEWKGAGYHRQAWHRAFNQLKDAGFLVQGPESLWISTVGGLSTCQRGVNEASTVDEG